MEKELEPYRTSDLPLAGYLHYRGMAILTTRDDPNDQKREIFVFIDTPERTQYESDWRDDKDGCRSYWRSLRTVKHTLRGRNK